MKSGITPQWPGFGLGSVAGAGKVHRALVPASSWVLTDWQSPSETSKPANKPASHRVVSISSTVPASFTRGAFPLSPAWLSSSEILPQLDVHDRLQLMGSSVITPDGGEWA